MGMGALLAGGRSRLANLRGDTQPPPRGPYVQNVSASSAVIAWVSAKPGLGLVEYGETPRLGREGVDTRVGRRHAVVLSGLDPGSTYHYQVAGDEGGSETGRLHTAPEGEDSRFVFAVIGDSGRGRKQQLAVAALLERTAPDLILHTGDVVYPSGEDRHYDRRFFAPYRPAPQGGAGLPGPGQPRHREGQRRRIPRQLPPAAQRPTGYGALLFLRLRQRPLRRARQ